MLSGEGRFGLFYRKPLFHKYLQKSPNRCRIGVSTVSRLKTKAYVHRSEPDCDNRTGMAPRMPSSFYK
jgi:hypothetical protein